MWKVSVFQTISETEGAPELRRNMACWVLWQKGAASQPQAGTEAALKIR